MDELGAYFGYISVAFGFHLTPISREDLEYWLIDAAYMEFCCSEKFFMKRDILQVFCPQREIHWTGREICWLQEELEETAAKLEKDDEEDFGTGKFAK